MAQNFAREVAALRNIDRIDHVILNAGILQYPNVGLLYIHSDDLLHMLII